MPKYSASVPQLICWMQLHGSTLEYGASVARKLHYPSLVKQQSVPGCRSASI